MRDQLALTIPEEKEAEYLKVKEKLMQDGTWSSKVLRMIILGEALGLDRLEDWQIKDLKEFRKRIDATKLVAMENITYHSIEEYIAFGKMASLLRRGE